MTPADVAPLRLRGPFVFSAEGAIEDSLRASEGPLSARSALSLSNGERRGNAPFGYQEKGHAPEPPRGHRQKGTGPRAATSPRASRKRDRHRASSGTEKRGQAPKRPRGSRKGTEPEPPRLIEKRGQAPGVPTLPLILRSAWKKGGQAQEYTRAA
jgi:hypothetical protein